MGYILRFLPVQFSSLSNIQIFALRTVSAFDTSSQETTCFNMKYSFITTALVGAVLTVMGSATPISQSSPSIAISTPSFSSEYTKVAGPYTAMAADSTPPPVNAKGLFSLYAAYYSLGRAAPTSDFPERSTTVSTVGIPEETSITPSATATADLFPSFHPHFGHGPVVEGAGFNSSRVPSNSTSGKSESPAILHGVHPHHPHHTQDYGSIVEVTPTSTPTPTPTQGKALSMNLTATIEVTPTSAPTPNPDSQIATPVMEIGTGTRSVKSRIHKLDAQIALLSREIQRDNEMFKEFEKTYPYDLSSGTIAGFQAEEKRKLDRLDQLHKEKAAHEQMYKKLVHLRGEKAWRLSGYQEVSEAS